MKSSSVPELKGGQMVTILYGIGIIVLLYIVYKAMQKVGLIQSRASKEKAAAVQNLTTDAYFNPLYLQDKVGQFKALGANTATLYAQQIHHDLYYIFNIYPDTDDLNVVFGRLFNKCNVAEIALYYTSQYNRDLQADLLYKLTIKSDVVNLMNIVNALPDK